MADEISRYDDMAGAGLDQARSPLKTNCPACSGSRASSLFYKDGYDVAQCPECGFLFVHPYPGDEVLARHYETAYRGASADFYPKAFDRHWRGFWRSLLFLKYVWGKDVLDLGCGGGFMAHAFARLGARAAGIDISQNSIDYARKHFPRCDFYCESLATFRARGRKFDFVFSSEVIEHLPGPAEFMETVAAVTRPGGYVYVSAPDAGHRGVPADITKWGDICPP
jgi:SAM-dependent methyltransferase